MWTWTPEVRVPPLQSTKNQQGKQVLSMKVSKSCSVSCLLRASTPPCRSAAPHPNPGHPFLPAVNPCTPEATRSNVLSVEAQYRGDGCVADSAVPRLGWQVGGCAEAQWAAAHRQPSASRGLIHPVQVHSPEASWLDLSDV